MLMPAKNGFLSFKQIFIEWALHYWFLVVDKEIGTAKVRSLLSLESRRNTFKAGLPTSKWWLDISWNHQTSDNSSPEENVFFRGWTLWYCPSSSHYHHPQTPFPISGYKQLWGRTRKDTQGCQKQYGSITHGADWHLWMGTIFASHGREEAVIGDICVPSSDIRVQRKEDPVEYIYRSSPSSHFLSMSHDWPTLYAA